MLVIISYTTNRVDLIVLLDQNSMIDDIFSLNSIERNQL